MVSLWVSIQLLFPTAAAGVCTPQDKRGDLSWKRSSFQLSLKSAELSDALSSLLVPCFPVSGPGHLSQDRVS